MTRANRGGRGGRPAPRGGAGRGGAGANRGSGQGRAAGGTPPKTRTAATSVRPEGTDRSAVQVLRVGFVPGVEPDRFGARWSAGPRPARLETVPLAASEAEHALRRGEVDMCFVRLPLSEDADLHVVPLWEEAPVVVVGADNVLSLAAELTAEDLREEPEIPATGPDDAAERVAVVATGIGYTRLPLSLARLHHRKDAVHRPAPDAPVTRIALAWPRTADDALRQEFVGAVRGRTVRSSRGPDQGFSGQRSPGQGSPGQG